MNSSNNFVRQSLVIAGVVAAYWVVSISMVFLNNYLLSSEDVKLDAPLFITWYQCVVAVGTCWILGYLCSTYPGIFGTLVPPFEINFEVAKKVLPLSVIFVAMISFNNLCLKYVGVAFYNVGRSLTTVFNVGLSYAILGQSTSIRALGACAVIVAGFILGIDQEKSGGSLSVLGVLFGLSASAAVALNSIYVKKVLPFVNGNEFRLVLYNNFNGCFLFIPVMWLLGDISAAFNYEQILSSNFWFMMTLGGFFGVAISLVTTLQIKYTSPLTHNVSGTAKACAQTVMAVAVYNTEKSGLWWLSNFMVLGGSALYTQVRRQEMKAEEARKAAKEVGRV